MGTQLSYYEQDSYGTPNSYLLNEIKNSGFKPIGITILLCEETFIFKNKAEAHAAAEKFMPEGWYYGIDEWDATRREYIKDMYHGNEEAAPIVYWLDRNFAPKNK